MKLDPFNCVAWGTMALFVALFWACVISLAMGPAMKSVLLWFSGANAAFAFNFAIRGDAAPALFGACVAASGLAAAIWRRP